MVNMKTEEHPIRIQWEFQKIKEGKAIFEEMIVDNFSELPQR